MAEAPERGIRTIRGMTRPLWTSSALLLLLAGCGVPPAPDAAAAPESGKELPARTAESRQAVAGPRVLFLGDSLTAGLGLAEAEAFPAVVGRLLEEAGHPIQVVNAGVSGDTTADGLSRLPWLLRQDPDLVVLELGANDGLRGLPVEVTEENLHQMILLCREAGAALLLVGMQVPPNYGPDYARAFQEVYPRLARRDGVPLMPFLLDGVAGHPELNQADGIHPTVEGHRLIAAALAPWLERVLAGS